MPRRLRAPTLAMAAAALLAGCSGGADSGAETQWTRLIEATGALVGRDAPAPGRPAGAPALVIVDAPAGPTLMGEIPTIGGRSPLRLAARNGAVSTWQATDPVTVSLRAPGVVVATRGLPGDLHVADAAATAEALRRGVAADALPRRHRHLDGDRRLVDRSFVCTLRPAGGETVVLAQGRRPALRFDERCDSTDGGPGFTNRYWRDPAGAQILQSEQWLGPDLGTLRLQLQPG